MEDTIEFKLPVSGKIVTIRNYTTHNDDLASEKVLYASVEAKMNDKGKKSFTIPVANAVASEAVYISRLVRAIDGNDSRSFIEEALGEMRSADYEELEKKVAEIVEENSPKAKEAKKASKQDSDQK